MVAYQDPPGQSDKQPGRTWLQRLRVVAPLLAFPAIIVGLLFVWLARPPLTSCGLAEEPGNQLRFTFGTDRSPLVRSQTVRVTTGGESEDPELSVRLQSDLRSPQSRDQLPSSQISVGSTRIASSRVTITATVEPGQPEQVPAGCYRGHVLVDAGGESTELPIVVDLGSREGVRAVFAFGLLLGGAGLGLTIKWITESLTPLAYQRRRLDRLKRALDLENLPRGVLPIGAQLLLDDAEDRVQRNDVSGLDSILEPLERNRESLRAAAARIGALKRVMQAHGDKIRFTSGEFSDQMKRLVEIEREQIEVIRRIKWPEESKARSDAIDKFRENREAIDAVLEKLAKQDRSEPVQNAFRHVLEGSFDLARNELAAAQRDDAQAAGPVGTSDGSGISEDQEATGKPPASGRPVMAWMLGHARTFAALSSVLVVALIGLQVEYLSPVEFDSSLGDWLTLFIWALTVELSGVAILDVVARLGNVGAGLGRTA